MSPDGNRALSLADWLLHEAGSFGSTLEFVDALRRRLNEAGVDLSRMTTGVPILHPQVSSFSTLWNRGADAIEPLGAHALKGIDQPIAVFGLR